MDPLLPSVAEMRLMKLFWAQGPLSAREAHQGLPAHLGWAVSTTRTVLERMREKGLLKRRSAHGLAVYEAASSRVTVVGAALRRTLRELLEIEGHLPAAAFTGSRLLTKAEIEALEALLNAEDQ